MVRERTQMLTELASKGLVKMRPKPDALEILGMPLDAGVNLKPYLLGIFGSAFGVLQVKRCNIFTSYLTVIKPLLVLRYITGIFF